MYIIERLQRITQLTGITVATSDNDGDQGIELFCVDNGIPCYRGDLDNVVRRFAGALAMFPTDAFVRVNGDSPLLDPGLIEQGIEIFLTGGYDLVTNVFPRSYPKGQSVEIISSETFKRTAENITEKDDREHVTRFFYNNAKEFQIHNISSNRDLSHVQLSVDTADDMRTFEAIVSRMNRPHWEYGLEEILKLRSLWAGQA